LSDILIFPHVGALRLPHRRFFRPAAVTAIMDATSAHAPARRHDLGCRRPERDSVAVALAARRLEKTLSSSKTKTRHEMPVEQIGLWILILRGQRVILDREPAAIYGSTTRRLNEQVKRNRDRFPEDFMLRLSAAEYTALISQNATSKLGRGGRRKLPWAFTEHGAIQAANVLNSPRAIAMGVYVVRAFVQLRELLASNKDLARRLDELEARLDKKLATHDEAITAILSAIRQLMNPPAPKRRGIGFTANIDEKP
jgi:hypothetical protein